VTKKEAECTRNVAIVVLIRRNGILDAMASTKHVNMWAMDKPPRLTFNARLAVAQPAINAS
jgi:hypothetical protein